MQPIRRMTQTTVVQAQWKCDAPTGVRPARGSWALRAACAALLACLLAGVAGAATTRGNLDRPPYYDGKLKVAVRPAAHVPVKYRVVPGSLDPTPARSKALAAVLDSLNSELSRLGLTVALAADMGTQRPPDVTFGCRRGGTEPNGTPRASDEVDPTEPRRMAFRLEDASKPWRELVRLAAGDSLRAIVCVQLGFDEYWVRQKDWKGNKVIDLGSTRSMPLTWLTSLDDPVQVLQLTAALVAPDGRVIRVGAEGLLARRTGMTASMVGAQEILTEDDLRTLTEPGPDGSAPVWRAALRELVSRLLEAKPDAR